MEPEGDEAHGPVRQIEIRMVFAEQVRYVKGNPVREAGPDPARVMAALHPELERAVQAVYGEQTTLVINEGKSSDIRLTGNFFEKAPVTRAAVGVMLAAALEELELGDE
jgi:hypothetical protein